MRVSSNCSSELPAMCPASLASAKRPYTSVPLRATTVSPTVKSVSRLAWNTSPTWFFEESTPSIMRTSMDSPAGTVMAPPGAELAALGPDIRRAGAAIGAGFDTGAADGEPPVNVSATISEVLKVWTSLLISNRNTACVPPKYFPFKTRPSFNSNVSANAAPMKNRPRATAASDRITLFIASSLRRRVTKPHDLRSVLSRRKAHPDSIALDDGQVANGCAGCNNGRPRRNGLEKEHLLQPEKLRTIFPGRRGLRFKGKGLDRNGLGPHGPRTRMGSLSPVPAACCVAYG